MPTFTWARLHFCTFPKHFRDMTTSLNFCESFISLQSASLNYSCHPVDRAAGAGGAHWSIRPEFSEWEPDVAHHLSNHWAEGTVWCKISISQYKTGNHKNLENCIQIIARKHSHTKYLRHAKRILGPHLLVFRQLILFKVTSALLPFDVYILLESIHHKCIYNMVNLISKIKIPSTGMRQQLSNF